jgi:hemolysin activation/secretion protein
VGPWQMGGTVFVPQNWPYFADNRFSIYSSPQTRELRYLSFAQNIPVLSNGLRLSLNTDYSRSDPGYTLSASDVWSKYMSLQVGISYPLILSRYERLDLQARFDVNNVESTLLSLPFYDDRLRVLRAGMNYQDTSGVGQIQADMMFSQGFDILGARKAGSPNLSRTQGRSDFNKIEVNVSYAQNINDAWFYRLGLSGQYATAPLLSSEEFGFGGGTRGRGYDPSEITGDSGVSASLEVGYRGFEGFSLLEMPVEVEPFGFYESGKVWNRDNGSSPVSGASAGAGVRVFVNNHLSLTGTVAWPLTRSADNPLHSGDEGPRYLFGLQYTF